MSCHPSRALGVRRALRVSAHPRVLSEGSRRLRRLGTPSLAVVRARHRGRRRPHLGAVYCGALRRRRQRLCRAEHHQRIDLHALLAQKASLVRPRRALTGFLKVHPPGIRVPLPWDAALLVSEVLLQVPYQQDRVLAGCALLLQFDLYLRPGEVLAITAQAIVRPTGKYRPWGVVVAPSDAPGGRPSKTGEWDDTVFAGVTGAPRQVAVVVLRRLLESSTPARPLLFDGLNVASYNRVVAQAAVAADLGRLRISPHCARHGGPSEDRYFSRQDLREIARRGRLKCLRSVRRYEKHGRLQKQVQRIPHDALRRVESLGAAANAGIIALLNASMMWLSAQRRGPARPPAAQRPYGGYGQRTKL